MSQCIKCGTNFVGTPENPPAPGLCKYCEIEQLKTALDELVKFQAHYATLLNQYDGGSRIAFKNADEWIARLKIIGTIK